MAQFIKQHTIGGLYPGLRNAAATVRNLVDLGTGGVGAILNSFLNGVNTSTMSTFNSLANMLSACVQTEANCQTLFLDAPSSRGKIPENTLQAMVNIAHNPGQNVVDLLRFSQLQPTYQPALPSSAAGNSDGSVDSINSWVLAIRYNGGTGAETDYGQKMDGPGKIAFDKEGNSWINNNYEFDLSKAPVIPVCGSTKIIKLTPTGYGAPGSPYGGLDSNLPVPGEINSGANAGGLYGAGFGIGLDPLGNVWVSSFGFQGAECTNDTESLFISVAKFSSEGQTLSFPDGIPAENVAGGFGSEDPRRANIKAPQGIVSDKKGNIWMANCNNNSVTVLPGGNPDKAKNFSEIGTNAVPFQKPFDVAIDHRGHA